MKLIYCPECQDIQRLIPTITRHCDCGKSWGKYNEDGIGAIISSVAIPLGIGNQSFQAALTMMEVNPWRTWGVEFNAFIIPMSSDHITRE